MQYPGSQYRKDLVFLPSASKTYHNLTIHHLNLPAGKTAHRDEEKRNELVQAGAAAFFEVASGENMLAIVRKPEKPHQDMETLVGEAILAGGGDPDGLRCLTWGRHTGTNEFMECKHVFVDGLLQAPPAHYHALYRGVRIMPPGTPIDETQINELRLSEVEHELLQAVGRGAVRLTIRGDVRVTKAIVAEPLSLQAKPLSLVKLCPMQELQPKRHKRTSL